MGKTVIRFDLRHDFTVVVLNCDTLRLRVARPNDAFEPLLHSPRTVRRTHLNAKQGSLLLQNRSLLCAVRSTVPLQSTAVQLSAPHIT
jgi:hypothetical protein